MSEQAEPEPQTLLPKKRKGWPKGKRRTPRTPPPEQAEPPFEPVEAKGFLKNGQPFDIKAADFSRENGSYQFINFPPTRGMKTAIILNVSEVALISITAPESYIERLKQPAVIPPSPSAVPAYSSPVLPPPQTAFNPFAQIVREAQKNAAQAIPNAPGLPMSTVTSGEGTASVGAKIS